MPFQLVKPNVNIDFTGKRKIGFTLFGLALLLSLLSATLGNGLKLGIDFAGGVIAQVRFEQVVDDQTLKKSLDVPELPGLSIQRYGEVGRDYLLRFNSSEMAPVELRNRIETSLVKAFPDNPATMERLEVVGPKVGKDLTEKGLSAIFYAILTIAVYISGRFEQRWMAAAAMAACRCQHRHPCLRGHGHHFGCLLLHAPGLRACRCHKSSGSRSDSLGASLGAQHRP